VKFLRLRWTVYRVLTWLASRLDQQAFSVLVELDKKDSHFADRKWANELNARRALRGEPTSGMWVKSDNSKKRWPDYWERPLKR